MKVPSYQKQATLTNQTGGMRFTVSASPDQFSQVANAQINLFKQLENTFGKLHENEVKVQREGALAKAKNEWTSNSQKLELINQNQPIEKQISNWNTLSLRNTNKVANSISDKVVRKRFMSWASEENNTYVNNVNKLVRARFIDQAKTNILIDADNHIKKLVNSKVGSLQYNKSYDYIFSDTPIITFKDGKAQPPSLSVKQKLIQGNLMTAEAFFKWEKSTKSKVTADKVNKLYSQYGDKDDDGEVRKLITKLQDTQNGDFKDLDFVTRQNLIETGYKLADAIDRKIIAGDRQKLAKDKQERIIRHNKHHSKFAIQIENAKRGNTGSNTTNNGQKAMPSAFDIINAYKDDNLNYTQYEGLLKAITGDDAIKDNPLVVTQMINDLENAETPMAIDEIMAKYSKKIGRSGGLTLATYNAKNNMAQQYKDKTPFSQDVKMYGNALKKALGEDRQLNVFSKQDENPDRDFRLAEAIMFYHQKVTDPKNPVSPKIAYYETLENWRNAGGKGGLDLSTTMISPKVLKRMNLNETFKINDIAKWKPEDFEKALKAVDNIPNRDIDQKTKVATGVNGMTAVEKAIEKQKIKLIAREIEMEQIVKANQKNTSVKENNEVNEGEADGENNNSWLNKSWDWLTGGEESEVDKLKKKQNPPWQMPKL